MTDEPEVPTSKKIFDEAMADPNATATQRLYASLLTLPNLPREVTEAWSHLPYDAPVVLTKGAVEQLLDTIRITLFLHLKAADMCVDLARGSTADVENAAKHIGIGVIEDDQWFAEVRSMIIAATAGGNRE